MPGDRGAQPPMGGSSPPIRDDRLCQTQETAAHRDENLQSVETRPQPEPTVSPESADDADLTPHVQKAGDTAGTDRASAGASTVLGTTVPGC